MNNILSALSGAGGLAVAYGVFVLWRRVGRAAGDLAEAFKGIPQLVKSNQEVSQALHRFSGELEFLRTAMIGGTPPDATEGGAEAPRTSPRPGSGPSVQFPAWQPFVAMADAPDAEESDTVVLEQDDAALVEQESLDEIRSRGFAAGPEADPMANPPGLTANV